MPIPQDICRVQITFNLWNEGGPVEQAVTGFHLRLNHSPGNETDWPEIVQNWAEGVRDRWVTNVNGDLFANCVKASVVKVFHLDVTGHTIDEGQAPFEGASAWVGNTTDPLPWEDSVVLSTYSYEAGAFVPFKASRRGRMYLPPIGKGALSGLEGKVRDTFVTELVTAFVAFFDDVQGMHVGPGDPAFTDFADLVIVSPRRNFANKLTRIDMGNVVDVQTRRRRSETEQRTPGTW